MASTIRRSEYEGVAVGAGEGVVEAVSEWIIVRMANRSEREAK
jgi:hypothetical protein